MSSMSDRPGLKRCAVRIEGEQRTLGDWLEARGESGIAWKLDAAPAPESPLERVLLEAFLGSGYFERIEARSDLIVGWGRPGILVRQLPVSSGAVIYRLDLALLAPRRRVYVGVEVDGADYHDAPEQVQRDRRRDRVLAAAGWIVLRFSGSEVWGDATRCVAEVLDICMRRGRAA